MDELVPVLSLVLGYWESLVVGLVYDRDCQGFQKIFLIQKLIFLGPITQTQTPNHWRLSLDKRLIVSAPSVVSMLVLGPQ